jgi:hypothetical protein
MKKLYNKLVEKCRESDSFAWKLTAVGCTILAVIAAL